MPSPITPSPALGRRGEEGVGPRSVLPCTSGCDWAMSVLMSCGSNLRLGAAHLPANVRRLSAWPCPEPSAGWAGPFAIRDVPGDGGATTGNTPGSVGPEADLLLQQAPGRPR